MKWVVIAFHKRTHLLVSSVDLPTNVNDADVERSLPDVPEPKYGAIPITPSRRAAIEALVDRELNDPELDYFLELQSETWTNDE